MASPTLQQRTHFLEPDVDAYIYERVARSRHHGPRVTLSDVVNLAVRQMMQKEESAAKARKAKRP